MRRILIIGSGGSGKSTLARQLGDILKLEVIHLDACFWKPAWIESSKEEWRHTVDELLKRESWIMDGNFGGTLDVRLQRADTVIFLDLPRTLCLTRILKRRLRYRGRIRPDMTEGCPEKADFEFLKWIWDFPAQSRPEVLEKLRLHGKHTSTFILKSRREVSQFMKKLIVDADQRDRATTR